MNLAEPAYRLTGSFPRGEFLACLADPAFPSSVPANMPKATAARQGEHTFSSCVLRKDL